MFKFSRLFVLTTILLTIFSSRVLAAPDPETAYIFNSFSFLVHGFLVMLMAAGFCMLETGLVRAKKTLETITDFATENGASKDVMLQGIESFATGELPEIVRILRNVKNASMQSELAELGSQVD